MTAPRRRAGWAHRSSRPPASAILRRSGTGATPARASWTCSTKPPSTSRKGAEVTDDITLSMVLWKAASDRYEQLKSVWDSGRVGPAERERLATLIWGRLDATNLHASGLSMSLPEACRLSDALAAQLRVRLGLELSGAEVTTRLPVAARPVGTDPRPDRRRARRAPDTSRRPSSSRGWPAGSANSPRRPSGAATSAVCSSRWRSRPRPSSAISSSSSARRREAGASWRRRDDCAASWSVERPTSGRWSNAVWPRWIPPRTTRSRRSAPSVRCRTPWTALEPYLVRLDRVGRAMTMVEQAYSAALARHDELVRPA